MAHTSTSRSLDMLSMAPRLPLIAALAIRVADVVTVWDQRRRTRKALKDLDKHILWDIGITEHQAQKEARRPFYQP
ncbi:DUF1127 domain-containing protein [Arenibacterium halophilum]|uniref:DUF1127 domain-containing protein n=1 Tax=Arenibacterium halophilum TaxID=2583821 RepID=A0ABY2XAW9_9RHOB|nr:DUF1127 domain-containing protein [Arenibacterium halophilum]MAY88486.1 hypothetical protein [Pseudooceanicola sp.]MEC7258122.1 DUF1127 domain-containing protein [Pseudomonadota bacterium]TMV13517.1 DUF1127 domain-containing protein [Arenibacterium halophilum]|tara:strand:- start:1386 stop:1613 length:228 start_codon:yes stop_codon:yes gene_type:complete